MAEESDSEKTEPASQKRLEQAREEGDVPRSREVATFVVLMTAGAMLWMFGSSLVRDLEALRFGGYEIVDKGCKREIFIAGVLAQSFRRDVNQLIASEPTMEEIDEFLGNYESLMSQPVLLH
eukprot:gene21424-24301_t